MNECPFCRQNFLMMDRLVKHLMDRHMGEGPDGGWGLVECTSGGVNCWCGGGPFGTVRGEYQAMSEFARHLQGHGGAVAHYLEIALSLQDTKEKHR